MTYTGGCLCGNVTYRVTGELRHIIACHCKQCRKTSGHHVAATSADRADIAISGDVSWYQSSQDARRGFCGNCGSNLFWDAMAKPRISIFAGTLDGETGLQTEGHIFADDKGDYYTIPDDARVAGGYDPDLTTVKP